MKGKLLVWLMVAVLVLAMPLASLAEGDLGVIVIGGSETNTGSGGSYAVDATELKPGARIKVPGDYHLEFEGAVCFSDDFIQNGRCWYVLKTREDGAEEVRFDFPIGTHTFLAVGVWFTNATKENVLALKRLKCKVVFDDEFEFETTPVQTNPNQIGANNVTNTACLEGRPVEPLQRVWTAFFLSIPLYVRDSAKPLDAYITIDDGETYVVHLRDIMRAL